MIKTGLLVGPDLDGLADIVEEVDSGDVKLLIVDENIDNVLRVFEEGTIAQAVNALGARHNRYRGLARTHLQHVATASAINLRRIAAWLMGIRPGVTRVSSFAALAASS